MSNLIISIGRQFGSGGREIGKKVAKMLDVPYYDKELITIAAKESGFSEQILEYHDEKPTNSFLYSLVMDTYAIGFNTGFHDMPLNHKIFLAQFETIKKIAAKESCVIIGRCADYALEEEPGLLSIFIHAPLDVRAARVAEFEKITPDKARDVIIKNDRKRSNYYNYYTNKHWGDSQSYDFAINSNALGYDATAEMIVQIAKQHKKHLQ